MECFSESLPGKVEERGLEWVWNVSGRLTLEKLSLTFFLFFKFFNLEYNKNSILYCTDLVSVCM